MLSLLAMYSATLGSGYGRAQLSCERLSMSASSSLAQAQEVLLITKLGCMQLQDKQEDWDSQNDGCVPQAQHRVPLCASERV